MKVCYPSEYEIDQRRQEEQEEEEVGGTGAGAEPKAIGWITIDVSEGRLNS